VHFHLYKMTLEGKIAVANMLLFHAVVFVFRVLPCPTVYSGGPLPSATATLAIAATTFPVGWLSVLFADEFYGQPLLAVVFVPLNAYFWGYVLAKLVRAVRARKS